MEFKGILGERIDNRKIILRYFYLQNTEINIFLLTLIYICEGIGMDIRFYITYQKSTFL